MSEKNKELGLKSKWSRFLNIVGDPWVLCLLIITIVFIIYSSSTNNQELIAILTLIITLISGLLGGIISSRWTQTSELKVLVARGNSAIRSLKLILLNVNTIEKRTNDYIKNLDQENIEYKLISNNFQEVIEKCNILEEEIVSSIENWTDIIPEVANVKTQIGLISEMKNKEGILSKDIEDLHKEIESAKEEGSEEANKLREQLSSKSKQLEKTHAKLKDAEYKINNTALSGITSYTGSLGSSFLSSQKTNCSKCGKEYLSAGYFMDDVCSQCNPKSKNFLVGFTPGSLEQ
ncbi:hypothetical protein LCGC14_0354350 [marine sediment metagenome]|uniref:Uncharacterized protein n=1 Tax=marine sediment metagenome TaxID=412755 RepID=A0A0F9T9V2_9ZZZZ|nr:YrzE family protein [Maribacter sp.]HDZ04671.1 hypothetical protein [Maribacter sp.]